MSVFQVNKITRGKFQGSYKINHNPSGKYLSIHEKKTEAEYIAKGLAAISGIDTPNPSLKTLEQVRDSWYSLATKYTNM